jgi:hypothetical protein
MRSACLSSSDFGKRNAGSGTYTVRSGVRWNTTLPKTMAAHNNSVLSRLNFTRKASSPQSATPGNASVRG